MGSEWIEVGSALIKRSTIFAVSELSHDKYSEKWSFSVRIVNSPSVSGTIGISNKEESLIRKEHSSLKDLLKNS
jgi:hypothetical protein